MTYQPFPPLSSDNATPTRDEIETAIERLIDLLDAVDPDSDLEENGDAEPTLGAAEAYTPLPQTNWASGSSLWDECEEENEHGGDILDEPHDDLDQGDAEPFLGWPEQCGQGPSIGLDETSIAFDANDTDMIRVGREPELLDFSGTGYREGRRLLDELRRRRPDTQQSFVSINPALWR